MAQIPGSSLERITTNRKISALFADEVRALLFAFSFVAIILEIVLITWKSSGDLSRDQFMLSFIGLFVLFTVLEYLFRMFVNIRIAALLSLIPALIMAFLLRDSEALPYIKYAILVAVLTRILIVYMPYRDKIIIYGCFVLDIAAVFICFYLGRFQGEFYSNKLLFIFLVLLTLSAFQSTFPFYYFMIMGVILLLLPMGPKPIDWSPVMEFGERLVSKAQDLSYYLPFHNDGGTYSAGYSTFNTTGRELKKGNKSEKTQLILKLATSDRPFVTFRDQESGQTMKMRRNIYLAGGKAVDKAQFARFVNFLYANDVEKDEAHLFSQVSQVTVEYAYIDTKDEIAPWNSIILEAGNESIENGVNDTIHRKGYNIEADYLDIDYGSPYLMAMFENAEVTEEKQALSYSEASDYVYEIYGLKLEKVLDENEYNDIFSGNTQDEFLETTGCSLQMMELSKELTDGIDGDYDKCRIIERYLRQYPYSLNAEGGYKTDSDMSTPDGMADIADRFLFDTQEGYCVHYTTAMIMLLRLNGIPARAQVGYCYSFPFEIQEDYKVSSQCAHTWPEAYIENVGWVPFEPTCAYHTFEDFTWHRAPVRELDTEVEGLQANEPMVVKELELIPDESAEEEEEPESKLATEAIRIVVPVAASIISLLLVIILVSILARQIHYHNGSLEEKLRIDVVQIKKAIYRLAPEGFKDRGLLSDYVTLAPKEIQPDLQLVFDAYYRSIYGNESSENVTFEENELARNIREALRSKRKRDNI